MGMYANARNGWRSLCLTVALVFSLGMVPPFAFAADPAAAEGGALSEAESIDVEETAPFETEPDVSADIQEEGTVLHAWSPAPPVDGKKYVVTADATGAEIARVDSLSEAVYQTMTVDGESFTITLLENDDDSDVVAVLGYSDSPKKITLTSGEGGPYVIEKGPGTIEAYRYHIAVSANSHITLRNVILDGGNLYGGILMNENTRITLDEGATVQNCVSIPHSTGGAINLYKDNSTLIMNEGSSVINNKTTNSDGGGIYIDPGSELIIRGGVVSGNHSGSNGGGICSFGTTTISGATITNNTAEKAGGGICALGTLMVDGSTVSNNSADFDNKTGYGGGIYAKATSTITNSEISGNTAYYAGGMYFPATSVVSIENSEISGNTGYYAGGIYTAGQIDLTNTLISGNTGTAGGGAYFGGSAVGEMSNTSVRGNLGYWGGGAYISNDTAALHIKDGSTVIENKSMTDGGGLYARDYSYKTPADPAKYQNITIENTVVFEGNVAERGLFNPPSNTDEFADLGFVKTSATGKGLISPDHVLNNYDINHKNDESLVEVFPITYHANGGQGEDYTEEASSQVDYLVKGNSEIGFSYKGHDFVGWNLSPDGTGQSFSPGDVLKAAPGMILYAQWEPVATLPDGGEDGNGKPEPSPLPDGERGSLSQVGDSGLSLALVGLAVVSGGAAIAVRRMFERK